MLSTVAGAADCAGKRSLQHVRALWAPQRWTGNTHHSSVEGSEWYYRRQAKDFDAIQDLFDQAKQIYQDV